MSTVIHQAIVYFSNYEDPSELIGMLDALQNDADRYRWLRQQPNNTDTPRIDVVRWTAADESVNEGEGLRMEELDAAIDAAKEQQ